MVGTKDMLFAAARAAEARSFISLIEVIISIFQ